MIKNFFKPTKGIVILGIIFLAWHILYAYQLPFLLSLEQYLPYLPLGMEIINWNGYIVKKFSFIFLWLIFAFFIFGLLWFKEFISVILYNNKVKKSCVNQPGESYEHLLRQKPYSFKDHILPQLIISGSYVAFLLVFFVGVKYIEYFRFSTLNMLLVDMLESGTEINYNSPVFEVISFVWTVPVWYIASAGLAWVYKQGKQEEEEEKVVEEHFAVAVE